MSISADEISSTVARYLDRYPDEADHLEPLSQALTTAVDLTSRKSFRGGHVTCGAVVIDPVQRLLLIQHKALNRWLLPGGHLEPKDVTLPDAALRELAEETGISLPGAPAQFRRHATLVDIDIHTIPSNPVKGEPEHWHADFRWLLRVQESTVALQVEEVDGYAWRPQADAPTTKLAAKLAAL